MKYINNPVENHLFIVVIFFVSFLTLISVFISEVIFQNYSTIAKIIFLSTSLIVLYFGREKIFLFTINKVPGINLKSNLSTGDWMISITFDDNDGAGQKTRFGVVTMTSSLLGVKIHGDKLQDTKSNSITMPGWYADSAEMLSYDDYEILYYLYKIPLNDGLEKIGFVCTGRKKNETTFVGIFNDIKINSGITNQQLRKGQITLTRR